MISAVTRFGLHREIEEQQRDRHLPWIFYNKARFPVRLDPNPEIFVYITYTFGVHTKLVLLLRDLPGIVRGRSVLGRLGRLITATLACAS